MTTKEAAIMGGGILPEVAGITVTEAEGAGLPLAIGCVMLMKETAGGRNVYGHDAVKCGPVGGAVTEENYRAYLQNRSRCGAQGVGPAQLTYPGIQDRADELGGCWRPEINIRVGFELLASYVKTGSVRDAFSRYNTGKAGDTPYARDAMNKLPQWERIVAQADETGDDMAEVPQWQWDRVFNRVLRMSAGVAGENHNGEQFNHEQARTDDIIARLTKIEELLANKNLANIPQWQWDRVLNRVLRMSAGVAGENHNGEQFNHEQARTDDIIARLAKIESKLPG